MGQIHKLTWIQNYIKGRTVICTNNLPVRIVQDTALISTALKLCWPVWRHRWRSKTCGRCFLQEFLEWSKQWSSPQFLLLLKQNTTASYISAMQGINLQHNEAERQFIPKHGELRTFLFLCCSRWKQRQKGRKMVDKNVLKQPPHTPQKHWVWV